MDAYLVLENNDRSGPAPTVRLLDPTTIRRLKSEQQITNVATAVKELIENALDAKAKSITITLEGNGLESIKVVDDGTGMTKESLQLCCKRYYTSKITSYDDLATWTGLGFKGEALASLADVSEKVTITSKTAQEVISNECTYDRNGEPTVLPQPSSPITTHGTVVVVKRLFKWFPPRLEMLRKDNAWAAAVHLVKEYSLAWPEVRFHLRSPALDKGTFLSPAVGTLEEKILDLWGPAADELNIKQLSPDDVNALLNPPLSDSQPSPPPDFVDPSQFTLPIGMQKLEVVLPRPDADDSLVFRSGSEDRVFCFVNRRPVALDFVKKHLIKPIRVHFRAAPSKFPFFLVHLTIAPSAYDINITPDKRKVLLLEEEKIKNVLIAVTQKYFPTEVEITTGVAKTPLSAVKRSPMFSKDARPTTGAVPRLLNFQSPTKNTQASPVNRATPATSDEEPRQPTMESFFSTAPNPPDPPASLDALDALALAGSTTQPSQTKRPTTTDSPPKSKATRSDTSPEKEAVDDEETVEEPEFRKPAPKEKSTSTLKPKTEPPRSPTKGSKDASVEMSIDDAADDSEVSHGPALAEDDLSDVKPDYSQDLGVLSSQELVVELLAKTQKRASSREKLEDQTQSQDEDTPLSQQNLAEMQVVGQLKTGPLKIFVCHLGLALYCCDQRRVLETILYQRLLSTQHFLPNSIGDPIQIEEPKESDDEVTFVCYNVVHTLTTTAEELKLRRDVIRKVLTINGFNVRAHTDPNGGVPRVYIDSYYDKFEHLGQELREVLVAIDELLKKCDNLDGDSMKKLHRHVAFAFDHHELYEDSVMSAQAFVDRLTRSAEVKGGPAQKDFDKLMLQWIPRTVSIKARLRILSHALMRRVTAAQDLASQAFAAANIRAMLRAGTCIATLNLSNKSNKWHEAWDMTCPHKKVCFHVLEEQTAAAPAGNPK